MPVNKTTAHCLFRDTNEHHRLCYELVLSLNLYIKKVVLFLFVFYRVNKGNPLKEEFITLAPFIQE